MSKLPDEIRAKLIGGGSPVKPSRADLKAAFAKTPPPDPFTAEERARKNELNASGGGLSGASKAWAEKFDRINDSEFWIALCFRTPAARTRFLTHLGIAESGVELVNGDTVAAKLGVALDQTAAGADDVRAKLRTATARLKVSRDEIRNALQMRPHPDPLADTADHPDDLEAEAAAELAALASHLAAPSQAWYERFGTTLDSPHWVAVCFRDRAEKERFLNLTGLIQLGDKYLDGDKAAIVLDIDLGA
ncbi:hypothetical protein ACIBCN_18745 [Nocardia sp. NPDC051052]|uniref:hypothetical protein n=1 Tax=Nocardia sp. NPDC051052 TaxID=3364322 RepID=UPI00379958CC